MSVWWLQTVAFFLFVLQMHKFSVMYFYCLIRQTVNDLNTQKCTHVENKHQYKRTFPASCAPEEDLAATQLVIIQHLTTLKVKSASLTKEHPCCGSLRMRFD